MIITDKFVFIHYPKNGGTFVHQTLEKIFDNYKSKYPKSGISFEYIRVKNKHRSIKRSNATQHGGCSQVPKRYRDRPIISIIRNPFDRLVSLYKFRGWERNPHAPLDVLRRDYPGFPDLTFGEYFSMINKYMLRNYKFDLNEDSIIGSQTVQFMNLFFRKPEKCIKKFDDAYINSKSYMTDMYPVIFIRNENLNAQLHTILMQLMYPVELLDEILSAPKIYPFNKTRDDNDDWRRYYDQKMIDNMFRRERLLFDLFPEYVP